MAFMRSLAVPPLRVMKLVGPALRVVLTDDFDMGAAFQLEGAAGRGKARVPDSLLVLVAAKSSTSLALLLRLV